MSPTLIPRTPSGHALAFLDSPYAPGSFRSRLPVVVFLHKNIRGIGVNENSENHSGHNHTMLHELAHHVWQEELTPEQRKIFQDDNPISDYAKSVKEGKEKTLAKHDEEDFLKKNYTL